MAAENLKSAVITALDTLPLIANNAGSGAQGYSKALNAYITPTSGVSVGSTYKMVRIPTTCFVKHVYIEGAAETAGAYNVGLWYSDGPANGLYDGTPPAVSNTVVNATFFAAAYSLASATLEPTDITNQATNYPASLRNQPIWQAAGLASDPGGFFDVVLASSTGDTTGALIGLEVVINF